MQCCDGVCVPCAMGRLVPLGRDGKPAAFTSERIGGQTDPTWPDGGRSHSWLCSAGCALRRSRPYGIEVIPVDGETLDPPRQEFLVLAALEPFADGFLQLIITHE